MYLCLNLFTISATTYLPIYLPTYLPTYCEVTYFSRLKILVIEKGPFFELFFLSLSRPSSIKSLKYQRREWVCNKEKGGLRRSKGLRNLLKVNQRPIKGQSLLDPFSVKHFDLFGALGKVKLLRQRLPSNCTFSSKVENTHCRCI